MTTGTKSLLFGVHQFIWHPITVWLAWRELYGRCPDFWETVAIIVHDWGYWGCEHLDDAVGERHPITGALLIWNLYIFTHPLRGADRFDRAWELYNLVRQHSRYLAARDEETPSKLCWADKLSMCYDPMRFYLFRARLSGELAEYRAHAAEIITAVWPDSTWFEWLRDKCERDAREKRPAKPRKFL